MGKRCKFKHLRMTALGQGGTGKSVLNKLVSVIRQCFKTIIVYIYLLTLNQQLSMLVEGEQEV
jgi:hypothetical protein